MRIESKIRKMELIKDEELFCSTYEKYFKSKVLNDILHFYL